MQIFVCGMHRSGTSVIARLLNMIGAYFGPEGSGLPANADNPKGFWERADIVALNDAILEDAGARWFDPYAWVRRDRAEPSAALANDIRARVLDLDGQRPWFVKDPRLCLTLGAWLPHCERPVAVLCSRDAEPAVSSLVKHSTSLGFRFRRDEAEALWDAYNRSLLRETAALPRVYIGYENVLAAPMREVERLCDELRDLGVVGLRLPDRREVEAFIDPRLQRHGGRADAPPPDAMAVALSGKGTTESFMTIPPETLQVLERLHDRIVRLDEVATSGLHDPAAVAFIRERLTGLRGPDDAEWSVAALRTLLEAPDRRDN